jgi:hypothetical protein
MNWVIAVCVLAWGCARPSSTGEFRVFYPDASARGLRARVGERMEASPAADCFNKEGSKARWATTGARVVSGELPPGLEIADGAIAGAPTKAGTWNATIRFAGVTCATSPVADQTIDVKIVVTPAK